MTYRAGVLTVSDAGSRGEREDTAGPAVVTLLSGAGFEVVGRALLPDEPDQIAAQLLRWADEDDLDVIVTTGGTGLSPRDRTPEATERVIAFHVPGLEEAMRAASMAHVPTAMLSRAVVGVRASTLILNLPGSERGARENLEVVLPVLDHACALLRERAEDAAQAHQALQDGPVTPE
ncbi:MAG: MogA/MoaB family molybdenum cofactor biosynthesis protein [Chloroflexi bacterium]|nr:MogA/MoaB family molybdenum cofactor biosynthesis protein [Chloroflexota bacterium]MDA1241362.1 MogA/MoaB family molybdenum cofactor biosynthesis protein [Chloroflexota bacterium]